MIRFLAVQNPYPPAEKALYSFASREDLKRWKLYSDATLGGGTFGALEPSDEPTDKVISEESFNFGASYTQYLKRS
jgi:hypothetical protein